MGKRSDLVAEVILHLRTYADIEVLAPQEKPSQDTPFASIALYDPIAKTKCYGITKGFNISVTSCKAIVTETGASDFEDWIYSNPLVGAVFTLENSSTGLVSVASDEWVRQINLIVFKGN